MKGKVAADWIAELRILADVTVDVVLVGDAADPVAAFVAEDVAAGEGDGAKLVANNRTPLDAEGNDRVLHIGKARTKAYTTPNSPVESAVVDHRAIAASKPNVSGGSS